MILPNRRRLGAIALVVAGVGAFLVPFLLHGPALQGTSTTTTTTTTKTPGTTGCTTNCPSSGAPPSSGGPPTTEPPHKKTLKDLMNAITACNTDNHGSQQSLVAKVRAAMKADDSTKTDNHLIVLSHELNTPAAAKHDGTCVAVIKSVLSSITAS